MNCVSAAGLPGDFDLAAGDRSSAQNTNALIVERMPFAAQIGCLKDGEFFFWWEMEVGLQGSRSKPEESGIWNPRPS